MDETSIHQHITDLVATERSLRDQLERGEITAEEEHQRLAQVEGELDRLWDLLRQRAAKREFGEDPDDARERSADTVEHYRN